MTVRRKKKEISLFFVRRKIIHQTQTEVRKDIFNKSKEKGRRVQLVQLVQPFETFSLVDLSL